MSLYPENEQWREKAGGECLKCRRHGYCKTQCKENRQMVYRIMIEGIRKGQAERKQAQAEAK